MVQVNNQQLKIRVKFKKVGRLQYISHLDLVRTMNKIIVRAGLPLWYTEGFNPKPKMVFAAPLSIGTESKTEYMDIRLSEYIEPEVVKSKLNENMTDEMQVLDAYYPETKFTDLKWLSYTFVIKTEGADALLVERCGAALAEEELWVLKSTKSGEAMVDIRPLVRSAVCVLDGDLLRINAHLSADPSSFLNPEYIIKLLRGKCGILSNGDLTSEWYSIMRERAYLDDMTEFR
ncbi:MAG: DUF2344 domain-containing protein [Clostridia bacterium]|nr:DUF2344 domain-containing protein [Clostridia bacterium]